MKNIFVTGLVILGLLAGFTGCKEKENPEVVPPQLSVNELQVNVTSAGGSYSVAYTLTDPEGETLPDAVCSADWIQNLKVNTEAIEFTVSANESQNERETQVTVTYAGVSPSPKFKVVQKGTAAPRIVLEQTEIEISSHGGKGKIGYSVTNAVEGVDVNVECEEEWVRNLWAKGGTVTFDIPENPEVQIRSAEVVLSYAGAEAPASFRISQAGAEEENPEPSVPVLTFEVNGVSFDMVYVEGDTFNMGATAEQEKEAWSNEFPVHEVTLSAYYIGKFEVTQGLWEAVTGVNPSNHKGNANFPVEQISRDEAIAFAASLSDLTGKHFALPTEAQWEFAARGGKYRTFKLYSGSDAIDEVAWYYDNSDLKSHPVGKKAPNELGLYDMSGNVWEWCSDWFGAYTCDSAIDPVGPDSGEYVVIRGGCFNNSVGGCRTSYRSSDSGVSNFNIGLRVVMLP